MVAWLLTQIERVQSLGTRALALRHRVMDAHGLCGWRGEVAFWCLALSALWPILGFALTRHPPQREVWRARAKARLRLGPPPVHLVDPRHLPLPVPPAPPPATIGRVIIVLPVFNAHALLTECLRRLACHTDLPWHLICIDDGSTDPRIATGLQDFATRHPTQVTLAGWAENAGFVAAANHGLSLALARERAESAHGAGRGTAIVLLNSDAFVPDGWASRLTAPFARGPKVATVTPLSNDAEILSVPIMGQGFDLLPAAGDQVDRVARRLPVQGAICELPTAIGFCMAIAPEWLRRIGLFDTAFGRGYGEEVDWCHRARRAGAVHLATAQVFVTHQGGASFGAAGKPARVRAQHAIIARRYPRHDAGVARFIARDPLCTARMALGVAMAGAIAGPRPVPVYLAHSGGGGAEAALQNRITADLALGLPAIVLRVGGAFRLRVECVTKIGILASFAESWAALAPLLDALALRRMIYSCGVGDPAPLEIPAALLALTQAAGGAEIWFHDYFPLSPSYTLLDHDGQFRGLPDAGAPAALLDPAHQWFALSRHRSAVAPPATTGRSDAPLGQWQDAWRRLAARAELVVFSRSSALFLRAVWPDLASHIRLRPHDVPRQNGGNGAAAPAPVAFSAAPPAPRLARRGGQTCLGMITPWSWASWAILPRTKGLRWCKFLPIASPVPRGTGPRMAARNSPAP